MHESQEWLLMFCAMASWRLHPGYQKPGMEPPTLESCADLADEAFRLYSKRFPLEEE